MASMQRSVPYAKALAARAPREVVIGIARDGQGKYNPIALGMFSHMAYDPPVLAVGIAKQQYSLEAFRLSQEFVIALPSEFQADETMLYGTKSGRDCDKLALAGAKTTPATKIDCVLLTDAAANYECRLISETPVGGHVVLFGEVLASHIADPPVRRLYTLGPGYRMGPLPG
jgi:flavin reductase (DIM6/NTAB) family NADH-FMN oxidoreductase RutF